MVKVPKFSLYGQNDPQIEEAIQPRLPFRKWDDLETGEKKIALKYIINKGWLDDYSKEILETIDYLNSVFLRQCPGRQLHDIKPEYDSRYGTDNESERRGAAFSDFQNIFINENSEALVLRMLSRFAERYIDPMELKWAENANDEKIREKHISEAFKKFDRLAKCLNHVFEQFSLNVHITRHGLIPKQDEKITDDIYEPTLKLLADPKWKTVSDNLTQMFADYRDENYPEVITKAHSAVQRFLQILVGEEGKSGKGEIGKLFRKAKKEGVISVDRFTEHIINVFQGFLASERATKSTDKPTLKGTTPSDALLVMNVVMVLMQHCLQNTK